MGEVKYYVSETGEMLAKKHNNPLWMFVAPTEVDSSEEPDIPPWERKLRPMSKEEIREAVNQELTELEFGKKLGAVVIKDMEVDNE